jgi:succinoglycan biosynthesis protein ExoA
MLVSPDQQWGSCMSSIAGAGLQEAPRPDHRPEGPGRHASLPFVTIAVPVLNEEAYIVPCLETLLSQGTEGSFEILVLDGGSTDRTVELVAGLQARHASIRIVRNPKRTQAAAINLASRIAAPQATILVRADAHAVYPGNFLSACVEAMQATGATSVVVPMRTVGTHGFQRAVAAAQNSRLGNGGSAHRVGGRSRFVEHGHHAAFDRAFFLRIGGYDESFTHNEDAEYDHRAALEGGRAWLCCEAAMTYFPRRDPVALARQYVRHGRGRAGTVLTHGMPLKPRQLAPVAVLCAIATALALLPLVPLAALLPLGYAAACTLWGAAIALRARDPWLLATGPAAMVMHLHWGFGFLSTALARKLRAAAPGWPGLTLAPKTAVSGRPVS